MNKSLNSTCKKFHPKSVFPFLLILVILAGVLSGCGKSVLDQTTAALNRSLPDETSSNVSVYAYKENMVDYILTADKIERFYNLRKLNAWQVKIVSYDEKMQIKSTLLADTTYVDEARNVIQAMGNVVLSSSNGTIKTRLIYWDRNIDEIYTPEQVTLIRDGKTLRGDNLRTNSTISYAELSTVSAEGTIQGNELDW